MTKMKNIDYDLFNEKIGYDSINKQYLIRVYPYLVSEMEHNPSPSWVGIVRLMLNFKLISGLNRQGTNPNGYYSSVRRCLKEIDVCYFDSTKRCFVKGSNWNRFTSGEDWSWFVMNTGSNQSSYVKETKNQYEKNYYGNHSY
jgi:hypothetical protein